ncbi:exonuclease domain-containing protein [Pseudoalteromonas marina]|uniref:Exonuclease domain-containing protein n=1 Tax=Pseudoalteromonas marina TaxID=267375 RepID=A0ABT9FBY4_9GAMM|nr:exonuclease domain-containing protein [Pseudoalteromonas marina]MDP2564302.1 exonuclease domain-containing protein [Pseudoalteromonas marina]
MSNKILVLDTELTCFETSADSLEKGPYEIIQFGMALVNLDNLEILKSGSYFVNNERHEVSSFCTNLTGITQSMLYKQGLPLGHVSELLRERWGVASKKTQVVCWGDEPAWMRPDFDIKCVDYPFRDNLLDLAHYHKFGKPFQKGLKLLDVAAEYGVEVERPIHNAKNDAITTARLLIAMIKRGCIWPWLNSN